MTDGSSVLRRRRQLLHGSHPGGSASLTLGQLVRLLLAAPGSKSGRYPLGNTGGADVSAFEPMPVPDEFRALLGLEEAG